MPRLPPAEKLALATRKNVRDDWESKKADLEKALSEKLGQAWTIDINPLAIFPYATEDWAKSSLGQVIHSYVDGAVRQLGYFADRQGAESLAELNSVVYSHTLTLDVDEAGANSYCGCAVQEGGRLAILFNEKNFAVNMDDAVQADKLLAALNSAPPAPGGDGAPKLSFAVRNSIRADYEPEIDAVRAKFSELLGRDIKLEPNFEALCATLSDPANAKHVRNDYESLVGAFVFQYFDGVARRMEWQKFGSDEMLQEGFNEAVDKGTIAFRIVDKLSYASYCEVVIEGGILYIQTTVEQYGSNISDAANKIVDQL